MPLASPTPAAIQAALESLYDGPAPEGAEDAMERALREPSPLSMAFCFFSSGWSMAPLSVRKAMCAEMAAARAAAAEADDDNLPDAVLTANGWEVA